ncbi:MAG TPA: M28 family peptidase [Gemmatimonadaceae bacterium]|nr:M28 family peptidase [Gemmatimonadaceae bacterium]
MLRRLLPLVAAACVADACARRDPVTLPDNVRAAADAVDSARLAADVTYLASDALLGRSTPSPGLDSAAAYIVRRLTQSGLTPAGDGGTFLQHYVVRNARRDTARTWFTLGGRHFREGADFLVISFADSGTVTAPMTYVGHGIRVPKKRIDPFAGVTVKGRIIVAHGPGVLPKGETFGSLGTPISDWVPSQLVAQQEGAAALVLINPPPMLTRWARPATRSIGLQSRALSPNPPGAYSGANFPVLWAKPHVAAALLASAPQGVRSVLANGEKRDFVPSFELPTHVTATIHLGMSSTTELRPYNVVAVIEGRDRSLRDEYVMLGAHLDGAAEGATAGDTIFNAADDNASGSAALLSIAEAMMRGPRPRRSVMFVWDTGEESGLWGSRYFAVHPPVPLERIVTHFNVDMIGRSKQPGTNVEGEEELAGPEEIYVVGPRVLSTALDSLLERTNRDYLGIGLNHTFDRADHPYFFPRTGAAPLVERGVLTVNVMNGEHGDYHGPGDEACKLDLRRMHRVTRTIFASVWMLAETRGRPAMDKRMPASVQRVP